MLDERLDQHMMFAVVPIEQLVGLRGQQTGGREQNGRDERWGINICCIYLTPLRMPFSKVCVCGGGGIEHIAVSIGCVASTAAFAQATLQEQEQEQATPRL